ncbi:MAG: hypothetical protein J5757_04705 [Lachnospiraceae bacterium]|nr:hypothetical protein [Lachnospiraceae bacterium]
MAILGERVAQQQYFFRKEELDKQEYALRDAEKEHRRYRMWFIGALIVMTGVYYITMVQDVFQIEKYKKDGSIEYALFMGGFSLVMVFVYVMYALILFFGVIAVVGLYRWMVVRDGANGRRMFYRSYVKLQKQRILEAREAMVEQKSRAREEKERAEMASKLQMESFIAMKNRVDGQMATDDLKPNLNGIASDSKGNLVIPIEDALRSINDEDEFE